MTEPVTDPTGEEVETPEQAKARRVAAFVARGPRYARHVWMVDADPFAIACELVDVLARVDLLCDSIRQLEFKLDQLTKGDR